jgi:hypothetical protein
LTASWLWLAAHGAAGAPLEVLTHTAPQQVFFGDGKRIALTLRNPNSQNFDHELQARIFQTSSATAVLLSEHPWKRLVVPADETVLESARLDFPAVAAATKFIVQWLADSNHIIGRTEVMVYPTNLLLELKPLAGNEGFGVFDPQGQLKPLLQNLKLEFTDLEDAGLERFAGKLAILGPFLCRTQIPQGLAEQILALAKRNTAIVWIRPPPPKRGQLSPSFYAVPEKQVATVIVQPELVSDLRDNPQAQLNLIFLCRLALHPEPLALPDLSPVP